jgi:hypothetical protein
MSSDFFKTLAGIDRQARRITPTEEQTVQEYLRVLETALYTDAAPEFEQRNGPYFVTAGNDLLNHSFEADMASWTEQITATGSTARDATLSKTLFGSLASCKLTMTTSGASAQVVRRYQDIAASVGQVRSFEAWCHVTALSNADFRLTVEWLDAGLAVLQTDEVIQSAVTTVFTRLEVLNKTAPASTAWVRVSVRLRSSAASATGTAYADIVRAELSATLRARASRGINGESKNSA